MLVGPQVLIVIWSGTDFAAVDGGHVYHHAAFAVDCYAALDGFQDFRFGKRWGAFANGKRTRYSTGSLHAKATGMTGAGDAHLPVRMKNSLLTLNKARG